MLDLWCYIDDCSYCRSAGLHNRLKYLQRRWDWYDGVASLRYFVLAGACGAVARHQQHQCCLSQSDGDRSCSGSRIRQRRVGWDVLVPTHILYDRGTTDLLKRLYTARATRLRVALAVVRCRISWRCSTRVFAQNVVQQSAAGAGVIRPSS